MTQQNTQALALIEPTDQRITALDEIARDGSMIAISDGNPFACAIRQANAIAKLRSALTDEIMAGVMSLQGSALGFKTDKDGKGGYPLPIVREALIEAVLRGLNPAGNQFNIIADRCYVTKEGLAHLLDKIDGLRWMITPQIPKMGASGAECTAHIEWRLSGGELQTKDIAFAIRVNSGMGADGVCGKCKRKAEAWLYSRLTGMDLADGDTSDVDAPQTRGRFNPIDVTPKEDAPQDDTPQNFREAGLTTEQVEAMYDYYKWPKDGMAKVNPAALKEAWARYTTEVAR